MEGKKYTQGNFLMVLFSFGNSHITSLFQAKTSISKIFRITSSFQANTSIVKNLVLHYQLDYENMDFKEFVSIKKLNER